MIIRKNDLKFKRKTKTRPQITQINTDVFSIDIFSVLICG